MRLASITFAVAILALSDSARASGEADATVISRYYRVRLSTGVRIMPAEDFGESDEPRPCPRVGYFAREEQELLARLGPAVPAITKLVDAARKTLPIVALEPVLPGPPALSAAIRPGVTISARERDEVRTWLAGGKGRSVLVFGRSRDDRRPVITLAVAVSKEVDGKKLDALADDVARLVAKVKPAESAVDARGCDLGPPVPAPVVLTVLEDRVRPGLRIRLGKAASAVDATQASWWRGQVDDYFARLEQVFVAELKGRAELSLPADWPAVPPEGASALVAAGEGGEAPAPANALYVTYAGLVPHVGFTVPMAQKPPEKLGSELFKALYYKVGPPEP